MDPLITAAETLARRAHLGQSRKDGGGPYIEHPRRVAGRLIARFPTDAALAAAAWCHDVIEDCPQISREELAAAIGPDAMALVVEATNPSKDQPHLPRAERKRMDREHIATISQRARYIKLADRGDNLRESLRSPRREWAAQYASESKALAAVLQGTDAELEAELWSAITAIVDRTP